MITRFLTAAALIAFAVPVAAQDFAITNATVATGDGSDPLQGATVVVRGGKVVAAGAGVAVPAGVQTVDGTGKWVTPGIFASLTTLGLYDAGGIQESNDISARGSPFGAALDVVPALNPASQHVAVARGNGVTRASVMAQPSGSIFGGQGAVVDLGADANMVVRPRAFQTVVLGETGARIAGGSRVSAHAVLRNALREARQYGNAPEIAGVRRPPELRTGDDLPIDPRLVDTREAREDVLLTRFDAAALGPVVNGTQLLYVFVERAADIRSVLALKSEFPRLRMVIAGASEGWMVARELAAAGVPVITNAMNDLPTNFEQMAATQSNVGRMVRAGVKVAIAPVGGGSGDQPSNLPQFAGNMVALAKVPGATGLTWGEAFAAISSVPAEIAGQGGRAGVLKAGAAGDLVIWDGDPLEVTSAAERTFIDGIEQPRDDHQRGLARRYLDLDTSDLPKAYDR